MAAWLFKTEPSDYAFADLVREKRVVWEGVSNALALIHLRNVKKGDVVAIYHTGAEKRVVGLAVAAGDPYADPKLKEPKRVVVDLAPGKTLPAPVSLSTFKTDPVLKATELVRNSRLSVMPLSEPQFARVLQLAEAWGS